MTPDDVADRAREMVGQRVRLTLDGTVGQHDGWVYVASGRSARVWISIQGDTSSDLVDIRPAPMRIEAGQLYRNGAGELLRGDADGGLTGFDGYIPPDAVRHDSDLTPVKVVDA